MTNNLSSGEIHKLPRLYLEAELMQAAQVNLDTAHNHYLRNVLRRQEGDYIRLFNGRSGEWLAKIVALGKKSGAVEIVDILREQLSESVGRGSVHLYFAPIKKVRMDMLIEKAVELGVSSLHPVITSRTEMRKLNEERIRAQIIEASEQCERMDIPELYPAQTLEEMLAGLAHNVFACIERKNDVRPLGEYVPDANAAFLIGPEGGFDDAEIAALLACEKITPVSLGENILRAETAALSCLAWVALAG